MQLPEGADASVAGQQPAMQHVEARMRAGSNALRGALGRILKRLGERNESLPCSMAIHTHDSETLTIGNDEPAVEVFIHNKRGMKALKSLSELDIIEAYIRGDIDIEGDFIKAMSFQDLLDDKQLWIKTWRWLRPILVGRERCNPAWIQKHYDSNNIQLLIADRDYHTYTPGIYDGDDDTMEEGAHRKLAFAFDSLGLRPGERALDVGCGWGGFMRYCVRNQVHATGITLSKNQFKFVEDKIRDENLDAEVLFQDFFSYRPEQKYDGISMMGVIEDLSDYDVVVERVARWIKPGGRIYLDFASAKEPDPTSSFVTKYVWPGRFRQAHMPEVISAIVRSPFEIVGLYNDRRNYHLWAKKGHSRWIEKKAKVIELAGEETYRLFRMLFAGTASVMDRPSHSNTAFRMVLELPEDAIGIPA